MKKLAILGLLLCLIQSASAVEVTMTVVWTLFASPLYTGVVCLENTDGFGVFDSVILEYDLNDHTGGIPAPSDVFLQDQGGDVYCAALEPTYWNSNNPDTLDNARISIKNGEDLVFQDDSWSTDVPVHVNDLTHEFHLIQVFCVDNDADGYYSNSSTCPAGNDCNDGIPTIHPNAAEMCNGMDDDCDGEIDEIQNTKADTNCNGCVENPEFTSFLNKWINVEVSGADFIAAANKWITLEGC